MFGIWTFVLLEAFWVVYSLFGLNCRYQSFGKQRSVNKTKPQMKCSRRDMKVYLPSYSFGGRGSGVGTWSIPFNLEPKTCYLFFSKIIMKQLGLHNVIVPRGPKKTNHPLPNLDSPPPTNESTRNFLNGFVLGKAPQWGYPQNKGLGWCNSRVWACKLGMCPPMRLFANPNARQKLP
jgi:hypothetical protein